MPASDPDEAPDDLRDHRLTRPDGRIVAFSEWGDATDRTVLRVPGTPGSRFSVRADVEPWRARNLRMITTERPGLGASTRLPGRGFNEHADDLAALLDHLGVDRVPIIGSSGAAPHILAFCARHPDRVVAATITVGAAPLENDEIDQMIGLNATAKRFVRDGDRGALTSLLSETRTSILDDPLGSFRSIMETAPPADQEIISDPDWQSSSVLDITEALRTGVEGWSMSHGRCSRRGTTSIPLR